MLVPSPMNLEDLVNHLDDIEIIFENSQKLDPAEGKDTLKKFLKVLCIPVFSYNALRVWRIFESNKELDTWCSTIQVKYSYIIVYTIIYGVILKYSVPVLLPLMLVLRNPSWNSFIGYLQSQCNTHTFHLLCFIVFQFFLFVLIGSNTFVLKPKFKRDKKELEDILGQRPIDEIGIANTTKEELAKSLVRQLENINNHLMINQNLTDKERKKLKQEKEQIERKLKELTFQDSIDINFTDWNRPDLLSDDITEEEEQDEEDPPFSGYGKNPY